RASQASRWVAHHTHRRRTWVHRRCDHSRETRMIRILLVDDQELVRTGLRSLAERDGDIQVVAEADNGLTGVSLARQHKPDVVLMDIRMPHMDGITATQAIVGD